jgi:hypothetical protein
MSLNFKIMERINRRIAPDFITELSQCEIFVFGSNLEGRHAGGAARIAHEKFGAVWGVGVGPTGQCYAIPTMHGGVDAIKPYVDQFVEYAKAHPQNRFLLTRIGCGIAGFKDEEIAPLFAEALPLQNVYLPMSFANIIENNEKRANLLTHAHGVTRTFADMVIARNKQIAFKSPDEILTYLNNYFTRIEESGDPVAFMAVDSFWSVIEQDNMFTPSGLDINRFRTELLDRFKLSEQVDQVYFEYCLEKICNVVIFLNQFRKYEYSDAVVEDLSSCGFASLSSCGPSNPMAKMMNPLNAGFEYPLHFFRIFLEDNWDSISANGIINPDRLNELMFNKHQRGLRKYGLEAVIAHDYHAPCFREVYLPRRLGTGPVYIQQEDNNYVRSCGNGIGTNMIPNYLEVQIALAVLQNDDRYERIGEYMIPKFDITLPILGEYTGIMSFNSDEDKRKFIDSLRRKR